MTRRIAIAKRLRRLALGATMALGAGGISYATAVTNGALAPDDGPRDSVAGDVDTLEAQLSGIDFLPDRDRLDGVVAGNAVADLVEMANDTGAQAGRRLRALRSLGAYDTGPAREALIETVERYDSAEAGIELVYLRAAIEALADLGGVAGDDTAIIIGDLLEHPSPDVRAAAARGLGDLGDPVGTGFLFRRLDVEKVPFVRAAIDRALRDLT